MHFSSYLANDYCTSFTAFFIWPETSVDNKDIRVLRPLVEKKERAYTRTRVLFLLPQRDLTHLLTVEVVLHSVAANDELAVTEELMSLSPVLP